MNIVMQLLNVLGPVVLEAVNDYRAAHNGEVPNHEQLMEQLNSDADKYLAEGAAWRAAHPRS